MNTDVLPTGSRSNDQEPVKARDTTTRRTRSVRRLVGVAIAGLALALVRRRLRRGSTGGRSESTSSSPDGLTGSSRNESGRSRAAGRGGRGRRLGRRIATMAASAAAAAAVRRLLARRSARRR